MMYANFTALTRVANLESGQQTHGNQIGVSHGRVSALEVGAKAATVTMPGKVIGFILVVAWLGRPTLPQ